MEIPKLDYLWQYIEYWAEKDTDFPTIRFRDKTVTAGELYRKTCRLAQVFLQRGVKKGDRIVTILPTCPEYTYCFLAAGMIGAITAPMDVRFRAADYRRFLGHVRPKVMILIGEKKDYNIADTIREISAEVDPGITFLRVGAGDFGVPLDDVLMNQYGLDQELDKARKALEPDDGTLIIFTGGTTGKPKAAMLSQKNVVSASYIESTHVKKYLDALGAPDRGRMLQNLPPSHVGGTVEMMSVYLAGGNEIIQQEDWSPYPVLQAIQDEKIMLIGAVPTMYAILLSLPDIVKFDLSSLKIAIVSGEKVSLELLQGIRSRICKNILNGYGSTESGPEITFTDLSDSLEKMADGYVGKPLSGQELKIVDENGRPLPPGREGELLIRGSLTIPGYFEMLEENEVTFTADGWCKSGDLCYLTEDGGLYIKGRLKHILRVGSYTVLPTEIEEIVVQHPTVGLCAAIGVPHKIYGNEIWLYVVPRWGQKADENEILQLCKKELADFKVPRKIIITENVPVTRLGKIDRVALEKQVIDSLQ